MFAKECGRGLQLRFQCDHTRNLYRQILESLPCFGCFENLRRTITNRSERNRVHAISQVEQAGILVQVAVEVLC